MKSLTILSYLAAISLAAPAAESLLDVAAPKIRVRASTQCYEQVVNGLNLKNTNDKILNNAYQSCMASVDSTGVLVSCVTTNALMSGVSPIKLGDFVRDLLKCATTETQVSASASASASASVSASMASDSASASTSSGMKAEDGDSMSCQQSIVNGMNTTTTDSRTLASVANTCLANGNVSDDITLFTSCVQTLALRSGVGFSIISDLIGSVLDSCPNTRKKRGIAKRQTVAACVESGGAIVDLNQADMDFAQEVVAACTSSDGDVDALYTCIQNYISANDTLDPPRVPGITSVAFSCSESTATAQDQ